LPQLPISSLKWSPFKVKKAFPNPWEGFFGVIYAQSGINIFKKSPKSDICIK
jgi:hypothetical protein